MDELRWNMVKLRANVREVVGARKQYSFADAQHCVLDLGGLHRLQLGVTSNPNYGAPEAVAVCT